jgi:hypothetical protein
MNLLSPRVVRASAFLAINLLFLTVWGFAGGSKLIDGMPSWFGAKFGKTFLGTFPGVTTTFWLLAGSELLAFGLGVMALLAVDFAGRKSAKFLPAMLAWSLFVFVELGFGLWLTGDFAGGFQQFMYFSGTLVALQFAVSRGTIDEETKP